MADDNGKTSERVIAKYVEKLSPDFDSNKIVTPKLSEAEIYELAIQNLSEDELSDYLKAEFLVKNHPLHERAVRLFSDAEDGRQHLKILTAKTRDTLSSIQKYSIYHKANPEEASTIFEKFMLMVFGVVGLGALFSVWNAAATYVLGSAEYEHILNTEILAYLFTFGAVCFSFVPKIYHDNLESESKKIIFKRRLGFSAVILAVAWLLVFSVYNGQADGDRIIPTRFLEVAIIVTQLALETTVGSLIWLWLYTAAMRKHLLTAKISPAHTCLADEENEQFELRLEMGDFSGRLKGFIVAVENAQKAFVRSSVGRVNAAKAELDVVRNSAVSERLKMIRNEKSFELMQVHGALGESGS